MGFYGNISENLVTLDYITVHIYTTVVASNSSLLLYSTGKKPYWEVIKDKNIYFFMERNFKLQNSKLKSNLKC